MVVLREFEDPETAIARAVAMASEDTGAALLFAAFIEPDSAVELALNDGTVASETRLREEVAMLFEGGRTVARRHGLEPETAVVRSGESNLATEIGSQAQRWNATDVVLCERPRGFLFGRLGRPLSERVERLVGPTVRVVRVSPRE